MLLAVTDHRSAFSRWLREPLVHFLVIGALLFVAFQWRGGPAGSNRIVITPGQIDAIATGFARTWQRPPTEQELKGLLDEHVREEVAAREAMAMGLDRDDTVIRRRLRQKYEFLAEEGADATPPTQAQLQAWLEANPGRFRSEAQVAFRQVMLSPQKRGGTLEADARKLLEQLARAGPEARIDALGDSLMLPGEVGRTSRSDVVRQFGEPFAAALFELEPGRWAGPVRSGYGLHVVLVREREEGRSPALAEVRPLVERDFTADRRRKSLDALYARMLDRYQVVIESRAEAPKAADPASPQRSGAAK
jgi:hypothetical protein